MPSNIATGVHGGRVMVYAGKLVWVVDGFEWRKNMLMRLSLLFTKYRGTKYQWASLLTLSLVFTGAIFFPVDYSSVQAEEVIGATEGLQHLDWKDARAALGEESLISGKIVHVGNAGRVNFLNFDRKRPPQFTGIIFNESLENFPQPLKKMYLGKIIRIHGRVVTYQDKPQIVITDPEQIEILTELPKTRAPVNSGQNVLVDGELRIATYNILNLFDGQDDPYHADESTPTKPRAELERLAESLRALNADVVALQEVENRGYLERFVQVFLPEMGYQEVVHFDGNDGRGIDVCLLSRVPIGPVRSHRHLRFTGPDGMERSFSRDLLAVTILPPGGDPFEIWVVHLKSNSGGREHAEPIRLAEVGQARQLLDQALAADPEARILLMGDFNDVWSSKTMRTLAGTGPTAFWSVASELGEKQPDTYNKGKFHSMIDFILCSPAMVKAYVKGSCRIIPGSTEKTGSDHNPVTAKFKIGA
ncbi:MAG: endonuclease/exonuclease/phosphatase family protein [Pirellulales bacterium]